MDEATRRSITWVIIIGLIGIIVITATYRRGELKSLASVIADGTPSQRIAAVKILIEKQKLAEALDDQPRWVQDNAIAAIAYIGDNEALLQAIGANWMLDKPVAPRGNDIVANENRAAITPLIAAMQDKDGNVRAGTSAPLIAIGPPTIPPLMTLISAWDQYVRDGIVAVFSGIAAPVTSKLIPVMKQKEPRKDQTPAEFQRARDTARRSLVGMKEPALGPITKELTVSPDTDTRADAAAMIGEIDATAGVKVPDIKNTVPKLLGLLNTDPAWPVRRKAATALGGLPTEPVTTNGVAVPKSLDDTCGATSSLIAHLGDKSNEVKAACAEALGKVGNTSACGPLTTTLIDNRTGATKEISVSLIQIAVLVTVPAAAADASPEVLKHHDDAVRQEGAIRRQVAITELKRALPNPDVEIRRTATETIGQIGGEEAVVPLAGMLKDTNDPIRETSADALRGLANKNIIPQLVDALYDRDWRVYQACRDALARVGKDAVPQLIAAMGGENPSVSYMAEEALARIGLDAIEPLTGALSSANPRVAEWAGVALGDIKGDAVKPVSTVLEDRSLPPSARAAAARALGRTGVKPATEPLVKAFPGAPAEVQEAIVKAIDELSAEGGTQTLVDALQAPSPAVREVATNVLRNWSIGDAQKLLLNVVTSGDENAKRRAAIVLAQQTSLATEELLSRATGISTERTEDLSGQLRPVLETAALDAGEIKTVRRGAVQALGSLGKSESLQALQTLLQPQNPYAGDAAKSVALIGSRVGETQAAGAKGVSEAADLLVRLLESTPDDHLRLQVAVALSTMRSLPVKAMLDGFLTASDEVKPWIAATLGAIGKPATDPVLDKRGIAQTPEQKAWCAASLQLIGDAQALDLLKHLPEDEQPDPAKVDAGQAILARIRASR